MQLFSSFGISFLHFSALTIWQFNFAFSVLRYHNSFFFSLKKNCQSLQLSLSNSWKVKFLNRTATTTQGPAGLSFHIPEVPLGKVLSSICALSGMGQVISKLFLTRSNLFRDKKEIMETISNMWHSFPNLTVNLFMGMGLAGFLPHPMCIGWGNWLGLTATPFPLCFHHFWALQKPGFAIIKQES